MVGAVARPPALPSLEARGGHTALAGVAGGDRRLLQLLATARRRWW